MLLKRYFISLLSIQTNNTNTIIFPSFFLIDSEILTYTHKSYQSGDTPLHWAAKNNHIESIEVLLAAGANVNAADDIVFLTISFYPNTTHKHNNISLFFLSLILKYSHTHKS